MLNEAINILFGKRAVISRADRLYLEKIAFINPDLHHLEKEKEHVLVDTGANVTCIPLVDTAWIFSTPLIDLYNILDTFRDEEVEVMEGFFRDKASTVSKEHNIIGLRKRITVELRQQPFHFKSQLNIFTAPEIEEPLLGMDFVDQFLLLVPKRPSNACFID